MKEALYDSGRNIIYTDIKLSCGFPSPALDYLEKRIDLNEVFIRHPLATFMAEVTGKSMINAFIPPGAKLIVDRSVTPENGDIVLAVLNGEFTVKFLKKNKFKISSQRLFLEKN